MPRFAILYVFAACLVMVSCAAQGPRLSLDETLAVGWYPSLGTLELRLGEGAPVGRRAKAAVQVTGEDGRSVFDGTVRFEPFIVTSFMNAREDRRAEADTVTVRHRALVKLPELADGTYEVRVTVGGDKTAVRRFLHKRYDWLGNDIGMNRKVYFPFTPIAVEGDTADVVLRRYRMNGFGLWDSVESRGRELLAAPISLVLETAKGIESWRFEPGEWTEHADDAAVYRASAESGPVRVKTTSTIEYDGCMKVEMELAPGPKPARIERLRLEILVKDSEAPMFHYCAMEGMRRNYAGETPRGGKIVWGPRPDGWLPPTWTAEPGSDDGILWTCRDIRPWGHVIATDFVPYIWVGGGERGLAFFTENDKGCLLDPEGVAQTLERRGDSLVLTVDIVNRPVTLKEPTRIVFGLQASPTRPMLPDWRNQRGVPPHAGPVVCWGGYICADKYPDNHNFAFVDSIMNVRKTGNIDWAVFEAFDRNRPQPWKKMWETNPWMGNDTRSFINNAKNRYAHLGPDSRAFPYTLENRYFGQVMETYLEEHASDITNEEWLVYQDEWRAQWPWPTRDEFVPDRQPATNFGAGQQNFPPSYLDFCLHYDNEWMTRGIGVYFDNAMPHTQYNPLTSAAYVDERGQVQPACSIWAQRAYYKRVWTRMMELVESGEPPYPIAYTQHVTNTRVLPMNTWTDATLDIEWRWYKQGEVKTADGKEISPFPHGLILAETAGRQTGSLPHALAGLTGVGREDKDLSPLVARAEWGMRTVHEVFPLWPFSGFDNYRKLETLKRDFGYGAEGCDVYNYWGDEPPVQVNDSEVKWILLSRPADRALLLVLQSWRADPVTVQAAIDPARLGFTPANVARDAETGAPVTIGGGVGPALTADLAGPYGTRVIAIGSKPGTRR